MPIDESALNMDIPDGFDPETGKVEEKPADGEGKEGVPVGSAQGRETDEDDTEGKAKAGKQKASGAEDEEAEEEVDEDETDEDDDGEKKKPEKPARVKISDDDTYEIDGKEISGKELKKQRMLHADYSRKRGEESKKIHEMEAEKAQFDRERENVKGYLKQLFNDPRFMLDELYHRARNTFSEALRQAAEDEYKLSQMDPDTRAIHEKNLERDRQDRINGRTRGAQEAQEKARQAAERSRELQKKYAEWVPAAMKESGLWADGDKDHNGEMLKLLKAQAISEYGDRDYSEDEIKASAVAVAESKAGQALMITRGNVDPEKLEKILGPEGVKALLKREAEKTAAASNPRASASEPGARKAKKKKAKKEPQTIGAVFEKLGREYGV